MTGPFGSGKSSILQTFRKRYPKDYHYLNLSLASFKEDEKIKKADKVLNEGEEPAKPETSDDDKSKVVAEQRKNEAQQLIELSILQQIFYKEKDTDIPDSRFKRIKPLTVKHQWEIVIISLISILAGGWLFFPEGVEKLPLMKCFSSSAPGLFVFIPFIFLFPGIIGVLFYLTRYVKDSGIKKLKISSGEIEINPKSEASILNKYLDELVYFFQVTQYNLVMIEDLDRFNDPEIFTKLRELNLLLNSSAQIGRRIVFVYAVRDDLFPDDRTRTKFFDFILPVIPVINWTNSLEKLKDKLSKFNFKVDPRFITAITLYIDDMRVLKNIFNELLLYNESLEIPVARQTKLLAMIVYKNIYPHDFAALHLNDGIVSKIFTAARLEQSNMIIDVDQKLGKKKEALKKLENIVPSSVNSLRGLYILCLIDKMNEFQYMELNGLRVKFQTLTDDNYFGLIRTQKKLTYFDTTNARRVLDYDFNEIEQAVNPLLNYEQMETLVSEKANGKIVDLETEIEILSRERSKISQYSITQLINANINKFDKISIEKKHMRLLRFLLTNGYIDLSYPYLISYFYPGSIGRSDMIFLTSVNDRIPLPMDYQLEKPTGLIDMIPIQDFSENVILNNDLMDEMLKNHLRYWEKITSVLSQVRERNKRPLEFMQRYVQVGKQVGKFIQFLCSSWPGLWMYAAQNFSDKDKFTYLNLILSYCDPAYIVSLNINNALADTINHSFLSIKEFSENISLDRLNELFGLLDVKFSFFSIDKTDRKFFDMIYNHNYYKLSGHNIFAIVKDTGVSDDELKNLYYANYSGIRKASALQLKNYIDSELNVYINTILFHIGRPLTDDESDLVEIYNHPSLDKDTRESLAKLETAKIIDLEKITDIDNKIILLNQNKVLPSWNNVLNYFAIDGEMDVTLFNYLNNADNAGVLGTSKIKPSKTYSQELTHTLELLILQDNDFSIEPYRELINAFHGNNPDFDFENLEGDKVTALIDQGYAGISISNISRLKKQHNSLHINLLMKYPKKLLSDFADFELDDSDLTEILEAGSLTLKQTSEILSHITPANVTGNSDLANAILKTWVKFKALKIDEKMLKAVFMYGTLENEKVILFSRFVANIIFALITELLDSIGGPYALINQKRQVTLPSNPTNLYIADILDDRDFVSSIKKDSDKGIVKLYTYQK